MGRFLRHDVYMSTVYRIGIYHTTLLIVDWAIQKSPSEYTASVSLLTFIMREMWHGHFGAKRLSASSGRCAWTSLGLRSLTQLEAPLPAPRYRLALAMVNCSWILVWLRVYATACLNAAPTSILPMLWPYCPMSDHRTGSTLRIPLSS